MAAVDNPEECSVCFTTYNAIDHHPRTLPCGHTFCSPCITRLIRDRQLLCLTCLTYHPVTSCNEFPVNIALLTMLLKLRGENEENQPPPAAAAAAVAAAAAAATEVREATIAAMHTVAADAGVTGKARPVTGAPQPVQIDAKDVCKNLSPRQPVYGVSQREGRSLYSKIEKKPSGVRGRTLLALHSLQDQPLPENAKLVSVDGFLSRFSHKKKAFLDLSWHNMIRRVLIELQDQTPLAQQFMLLCTGQRGHSYLSTKLLGVKTYGRGHMKYETVYGGDYEHNNGGGGAAILSRLQGAYKEASDVGDVGCWWDENHRTDAQFHIITQAPKTQRDAAVTERARIEGSIRSSLLKTNVEMGYFQQKVQSLFQQLDKDASRREDTEHNIRALFIELIEDAARRELKDIEQSITTLFNIFKEEDAARKAMRQKFNGFHVFGKVVDGMDAVQDAARQHGKGFKVEIADCGVEVS